MKNKFLLLGATALLSTALAINVSAGESELGSISFTASADIVNPITVTPGDNINFGTLLSPSKGDTVTVSDTGTISKTGSVTLLGGHNNGTFTLANSNDYPIFSTSNSIQVEIPDIILTTSDGAYCGYVSYFDITKGDSFASQTCAEDKKGSSCISLIPDDYEYGTEYYEGGLDGIVPYGAKLTIDDYQTYYDESPTKTLSSVQTGHCSGNGTMTFIYSFREDL